MSRNGGAFELATGDDIDRHLERMVDSDEPLELEGRRVLLVDVRIPPYEDRLAIDVRKQEDGED